MPFNPPLPNPFLLNLPLSTGFLFPSYIALLVFSVLVLYIIFNRFRTLINVYLSVLFFAISQLFLLIVLSVSWITELAYPGETESRCEVKQGLQIFALLLPGYCILIMTVIRSIFVTFPLSYFDFIRKKYQLGAFAGSILICALIATAPSLGLCKSIIQFVEVKTNDVDVEPNDELTYCSYDDRSNPGCKTFYSLVFAVGLLLPDLCVIALYIYIVRLAVKAKKTHRSLTESATTPGKETEVMTEQRSIPWSIIAILGACITTTLPWAGTIVYTVEITEMMAEKGAVSHVLDVFYAVLQVIIGCSLLVYLLTTNSLRIELIKILKTKWTGIR